MAYKRGTGRRGVSVFRKNGTGALVARWFDPQTGVRKEKSLTALGFTSKVTAKDYLATLARRLNLSRQHVELERAPGAQYEPPRFVGKTWEELKAAYTEFYESKYGLKGKERVLKSLRPFDQWLAGPGCRLTQTGDLREMDLVDLHNWLSTRLRRKPVRNAARGTKHVTSEPLSDAGRNHYIATIKAYLSWAAKNQYLRLKRYDVLENLPKIRATKKLPESLSPQDLTTLINVAVNKDSEFCFASRDNKAAYFSKIPSAESKPRHKPIAPMLLLLALTGLRLGEALHLRWESVDFERKVILVREDPATGWKPKTRIEREVPMLDSPGLEQLLSGLKLRRNGSAYVIQGDDPLKPKAFSRYQWNELVKAASLKTTPPKVLRSTFCTAMGAARGGPMPYELAHRMGHGVAVAEKHYNKPTAARVGGTIEEWLGIAAAVQSALTNLGLAVALRLTDEERKTA